MVEALARERAGDWTAAEIAFAETFDISIRAGDISVTVDALRGLCRVYQPQQRYEEAEEAGNLSLEIALLHGLTGAAARATNSLAAVWFHRQRWDKAGDLYRRARMLAVDVGDDTLVGYTCQNLGIVANVVGDVREARALYLESIGATARSGDRRTAMMIYNNLAMVCADLQDWMEAEIYFDRGIEIAEQLGDVPMLAKLRANRAEPLIHTGQITEARKAMDEAERLASPIRELRTLADIARFRSMIAREENDFRAAEQHVTRSLQLAQEAGLELELAEASEEHACLLTAQGRLREAVDALQRAQDRFRALGAQRDVARTQETLDGLLGATGTHFTASDFSV